MNSYRIWCLVGVAAAATGCSLASWSGRTARGTFERTFDIQGPVAVELETRSGDIDVHPQEAGHVTIKATVTVREGLFDRRDSEALLREVQAQPPIERTAEGLRIHLPDRRVSISYELLVPTGARLRTSTGSGHQFIEGISGPIDAHTGSGDFAVETARGDVRLRTDSGAVRLADSRGGRIELVSGSGEIEAAHVAGTLLARTGSGDIVIDGTPEGRWDLVSGSGSVTAHLPPDTGFDFEARTASGQIQVTYDHETRGDGSRSVQSGRVGAGGATLALATGSGDVTIDSATVVAQR